MDPAQCFDSGRCLSSPGGRFLQDQQSWFYPAMYEHDYPSPAPSDPSPGPRPHQALDFPSSDAMPAPFAQIDSSIGPARPPRRSASLKPGPLRRPSLSRDLSLSETLLPRVDSPLDRYGDSPHLASILHSPYNPDTPASMASPYSPYDRRSRTRSSCTFPPRAPSPTLSSVSAQTSTGSGSRGEPSREPAPRVKEKHHKHRLRDIDRKNICLHHIDNPNARQEDIGAVFGVERSTISKILKEKEKWLNISEEEEKDENSAKHRPSKFPEVEEEMLKSLQAWSDRGTSITDQLIRSRALEIAKSFQIPPEKFKGSSGWIENFKHRHDIKRGEWAKAVKHAGYPVGGTVGASVNTQPPPAGIPPTPVLTPYDQQRLDGGGGAEQHYKSVDGSGRLVSQWSSDGASHQAHGVQSMPLDPALHPSPSHSLSSIDSSSSHHSHMDHSPSHSHLHSQHSQHEHVLDHQHSHSQSQQDLSYYAAQQQQHAVYAPPPNPRPSLAEAEEAINVLITYLDTSGQTYIKMHERKILTDIKCAMFNHASGLPYERPP